MFAVRDETERAIILRRHLREFGFCEMKVRSGFRSPPRIVRFDASALIEFMLRFVRSPTSSVFWPRSDRQLLGYFGRDQSVTLSYSVSAGRAMCDYVCLGRLYVEKNVRITECPTTKITLCFTPSLYGWLCSCRAFDEDPQ